MSSLLLAVDAGTSACKAEVFTPEGRSLSRGKSDYGPGGAGPGRTELEPKALRAAAVAAVGKALEGRHPQEIGGVGVSAQLGLATLDAEGRPVGPLVTWADPRGAEQARSIGERLGDAEVYATCGRRVSPEWLLPRILHLRETDPARWARAQTHLSIKDYLLHELTGRRVTDPTHASYTLAFDVVSGRWATDILKALDLPEERLPEVVASHEVAGEARGPLAEEMGLPAGVPVIVGGPDGTMGVLGAGLVDERRAAGVAGTTDVFFACSRAPAFDPQRGTVLNRYVVPDRWAVGGPMSSTGGSLSWFLKNLARAEFEEEIRRGRSPYARLDALAASVPPGSDGLLCLPSLVGDRAPFWEPYRRGVFFGLSPRHGVGHLVRAIREGSAFASRILIERIESCGVKVREIVLAGGGAKSRLWCQIRADVLGVPVSTPKIVDSTNLGTALLVAVALGLHSDCAAAAETMVATHRRFDPDPERQEQYRPLYDAYRELRDALGPLERGRAVEKPAPRDDTAPTRIIRGPGETRT